MSDPSTLAAETHAATAPARTRTTAGTLRRLLRNPLGVLCSVYLLLLVVVAVIAPWLAPYGPTQTDIAATNAPPFTPGHLLGGDASGFDIFSRLIWGSRQTLIAVTIVAAVSAALGATVGLLAGYYRGPLETVASFIADSIMSLPGIVILIAMYGLTGPNLPAAMTVFGVIVAPTYFRLVRSVVHTVRKELYIDAARVTGLGDGRILARHVLWSVRAPIIIHTAIIMAAGISIEAGISFIGLGNPSSPSWGMTLQRSFDGIYVNPWGAVWPALAICLTILAFLLLGNALGDVLQANVRSSAVSARRRRALIAAAAADRALEAPVERGDRRDAELTNGSAAGSSAASATPSSEGASRSTPLLAIRDLRVGYPTADGVREVVHGIDLDLRPGQILGLVGESGSGKSQIAFSALGILPREAVVLSGSVLLDGVDLLADPRALRTARGQRIGYVPQEPMSNLDPSFTIGTQLVQGLLASRPMPRAQARSRIRDLLVRVGIEDAERVMSLYPHQISGGMAQRVLICGAIAPDPDVIVADEPTTALDVTVQAEVLDILRELSEERGLAMILVTHNLGVVADLCTHVTVMKEGAFVEQAEVIELFETPSSDYTRKLLASSRTVEIKEISA